MIMATIAENLTLLQSTKANIKQAIINKGVSVSDTDTFASYADKIGQISGGSSAATLDFSSVNYAQAPSYLKSGLDASAAYLNKWSSNTFIGDPELMFMPKVEITDSDPLYAPLIGENFPKLLIFPDIDFKHKNIDGHQWMSDSKALSIHLKNINFTGNLNELFSRCINLSDLTYSGITIDSDVTDASRCFYECSQLTTVPDLFNGAQTGLTNLNYMFYLCSNMITIDLSSWKFGQVISMQYMFASCYKVETIDITGIDTSKMKSSSDIQNMLIGSTNIIRIRGAIDLIGMKTASMPRLAYNLPNFTTITYKNIGCHTGTTTLYLGISEYEKWGLGDEESKQSFIDSVVTYSYDRTANGLPTIELNMNQQHKDL